MSVTANDLKALAVGWFGERGWQSRLAALLHVDRSTVTRWMQTGIVPGPVIAAVDCWARSGGPPADKP
jgi:hypothetical protein